MKRRNVPGWAGALCGVSFATVVSLLGYRWEVISWLDDFDFLTGWVQAVGSIAAIVAGFGVLAVQETARRAEQKNATQRLVLWVYQLGAQAVVQMSECVSLVERGAEEKRQRPKRQVELDHSDLSIIEAQFAKIDTAALLDGTFASQMLVLMMLLNRSISEIKAAEANLKDGAGHEHQTASLRENHLTAAKLLRSYAERMTAQGMKVPTHAPLPVET